MRKIFLKAFTPLEIRKKKFLTGFTLPDLIMAMFIIIIVAGAIITIYLMCYKAWHEATAQIALQRQGAIAMEKIVRGVRGASEDRKNGLREAKSFSIAANNNKIEFKSGVDNTERAFYLSDGRIMYVPDIFFSGGESVVAKDVKALEFYKLDDKRIEIYIGLEGYVKNKKIAVKLNTIVTARN